jgi:hypothetical protein
LNNSGFTHESHSALSIDWYTPKHIFDSLNIEFDLDPCCPIGGVPWIPAKNHYSLPQDGLSLPWSGTVWLNPPYGKETSKWINKMNQHRDGISLTMCRTDTKWFHDYLSNADALLMLKGRIQFVDAEHKAGSGSTCGSVLAAWGTKSVNALIGMKTQGYLVVNENKPKPESLFDIYDVASIII